MRQALASPPLTPIFAVSENLHGVETIDEYRWLEDATSLPVQQWLNAQAEYAKSFLDQIPCRNAISARVKEMLSVEVVDSPLVVQGRYFYRKRRAQQCQACIYMREGSAGQDHLLLDPRFGEADGFTSVHILKVSRDGNLLAFGAKKGGEHFIEVKFIDVQKSKLLNDCLPRGLFRGLTFAGGNKGFYYSHIPIGGTCSSHRSVCYHEFGTDFELDREIFHAGEDPSVKLSLRGSPCETRSLYLVSGSKHRRTKKVYFDELDTISVPKLIAERADDEVLSVSFAGKRIFALTQLDAPNLRIVEIDPDEPEPSMWREVVPEGPASIQEVITSETKLFLTYTAGVFNRSAVFDLNGNYFGTVPHPGTGTVRLLSCDPRGRELFYSFTSFNQPPKVMRYDCATAKSEVWAQKELPFRPSSINMQQVTFASKDGTRVPMFLVRDRSHPRSEPIPTVLTAYGGFGTSSTPQYTTFGTILIEQGCLFAVANVRGGSEFGQAWHEAGRLHNRQNAVDDFIAAAEFLLMQGITSRAQLGVVGASNGALLVAAAIVQRPDLFRAALCLGPLTDMLRYHLFGAGQFWIQEFGSADNVDDFEFLHAYSPYHRVRNGTQYPAVMLISGGRDYVCDPMHARKMTARLQRATNSGYPILLDYKDERGHSPSLPLTERVRGLTNRLAFVCDQLGIPVHEVQNK